MDSIVLPMVIVLFVAVIVLCAIIFLRRKSNNSNTIGLPIGQYSVKGDKEEFEICIVTEGKQYKFGANGDQIITYERNGNVERYGCE